MLKYVVFKIKPVHPLVYSVTLFLR